MLNGHARQLWIDEFHFEGDVHVTGAFLLRPKRRLWVQPATAAIDSGTIVVGKEPLLSGITGTITCTVPSFDPRVPTGMEFFRYISGMVRLDASIPNVRALNYYSRIRGSSVQFGGGAGEFHLDGTLHSGIVHPLNLSAVVNLVTAKREAWLALGSAVATANGNLEGPTTLQAQLAPFELRHDAEKSAVVAGSELRVYAITDAIDVSRPTPALDIQVNAPSAQFPNLRIINTLMSPASKLHIEHGTAAMTAQFTANTGSGRAHGMLAIGAQNISARYHDLKFGGRIVTSQ